MLNELLSLSRVSNLDDADSRRHKHKVGFHFHPNNDEIIDHYLKKRVLRIDLREIHEAIAEIDILDFEPPDLPAFSAVQSENQFWYFFYRLVDCQKRRRDGGGGGNNRTVKNGNGRWKATGSTHPLRSEKSNQQIGIKKILVYCPADGPRNSPEVNANFWSEWTMHEYHLPSDFPNPEKCVIVKLKKKGGYKPLDLSPANGEAINLTEEVCETLTSRVSSLDDSDSRRHKHNVGFHFHPNNDEIIDHYLKKRVLRIDLREIHEAIAEIDILDFEPPDLPAFSAVQSEDQYWYFFYRLVDCRKRRRDGDGGGGNNRTVKNGNGRWKATGSTHPLRSEKSNQQIGIKKILVYCPADGPRTSHEVKANFRSEWTMHEYHLPSDFPNPEKCVIVKLKKKGSYKPLDLSPANCEAINLTEEVCETLTSRVPSLDDADSRRHKHKVGFHFHPNNDEIIDHYLKKRVLRIDLREIHEAIAEIDILDFEPPDLPAFSAVQSEDQYWYFFYRLVDCQKRRRDGGGGNNRTVKNGKGRWKATGSTHPLRSEKSNQKIGIKKILVYCPADGPRTSPEVKANFRLEWTMHEYHLPSDFPNPEKCVIGKLKKKGGYKPLDLSPANGEAINLTEEVCETLTSRVSSLDDADSRRHKHKVGFHFHPNNDEIIDHYLKKRVLRIDLREIHEAIAEIDILDFEPPDLPAFSAVQSEDQYWYFFYRLVDCRKRRRDGGGGNNRTVKNGKGRWKATGSTHPLRSEKSNQQIGIKKILVYCPADGPRTSPEVKANFRLEWTMHEYHLPSDFPNPEKCVIGKLKKKGGYKPLDLSLGNGEAINLTEEVCETQVSICAC